jgi:hypothetical protein
MNEPYCHVQRSFIVQKFAIGAEEKIKGENQNKFSFVHLPLWMVIKEKRPIIEIW